MVLLIFTTPEVFNVVKFPVLADIFPIGVPSIKLFSIIESIISISSVSVPLIVVSIKFVLISVISDSVSTCSKIALPNIFLPSVLDIELLLLPFLLGTLAILLLFYV